MRVEEINHVCNGSLLAISVIRKWLDEIDITIEIVVSIKTTMTVKAVLELATSTTMKTTHQAFYCLFLSD